MRVFIGLMAALTLTACSIEGMVEKTVPENVRADHAAHIDRLLDRDMSRIVRAFDLNLEDEEVRKSLEGILDNVSNGKEIRRDYVGMNSSFHQSRAGRVRDVNLVTDVQTEFGFMTVTGKYKSMSNDQFLKLVNIEVVKSDTSPIRQGLESLKKVMKIVGFVLSTVALSLVLFLLRRRRRKLEA